MGLAAKKTSFEENFSIFIRRIAKGKHYSEQNEFLFINFHRLRTADGLERITKIHQDFNIHVQSRLFELRLVSPGTEKSVHILMKKKNTDRLLFSHHFNDRKENQSRRKTFRLP